MFLFADKPSPVPRHLKSASTKETKTSAARSVNQPTDVLDENIHPKVKAKPRPQPRKMAGDIKSEEGSPRSSKPEVTPRKWQSDSTTDHEQHIYGMRRKNKPRHDLSDSDDDDIVIDSRTENHKPSRVRNELEVRESSAKKVYSRKLKKESSEEDEYIDQDKTDKSSYSQKELDKGQIERKKVKSFQGEFVDKEDINFEKKYRGMVPAPKPRKHIQDEIHDTIPYNDIDSDTGNIEIDKDVRKKIKKVPVPKARKEHLVELQEKEIVSKSVLSKSRLHHLDVDDDDDDDSGEETHKKMVNEGGQMPNRGKNGLHEDKADGRLKNEKTLYWSSLDESDDDEAVGKKVNLFKKQRPSSAKTIDDNNNKEINKVPKPSPRTKPRKELANMKVQQQWQNDTLKNTMNYKDLNSTDYVSYQRVPREQGERDRPWSNTHSKRIATPQRPGSSRAQSHTGWGRNGEKAGITDMFEEHLPDTDDLIGGEHRKGNNK